MIKKTNRSRQEILNIHKRRHALSKCTCNNTSDSSQTNQNTSVPLDQQVTNRWDELKKEFNIINLTASKIASDIKSVSHTATKSGITDFHVNRLIGLANRYKQSVVPPAKAILNELHLLAVMAHSAQLDEVHREINSSIERLIHLTKAQL